MIKKKYLLVLDDVRNEDRGKWLKLRDILMGGSRGSKIIITTRSKLVAKITLTVSPYILKCSPKNNHGLYLSKWHLVKGKWPIILH